MPPVAPTPETVLREAARLLAEIRSVAMVLRLADGTVLVRASRQGAQALSYAGLLLQSAALQASPSPPPGPAPAPDPAPDPEEITRAVTEELEGAP